MRNIRKPKYAVKEENKNMEDKLAESIDRLSKEASINNNKDIDINNTNIDNKNIDNTNINNTNIDNNNTNIDNTNIDNTDEKLDDYIVLYLFI